MEYISSEISPLVSVESRLRDLTPAKMYAEVWINPSVRNLIRLFNHLRTVYRILYNYLPRQVVAALPEPGVNRFKWDTGTLMFTDLAGFTPLLEKNSQHGEEGAEALHAVLNSYFSEMIQIISKSTGNLLEFTGDAMLVQFPADAREQDTQQAIRTGLRMQRAMKKFEKFEILGEEFSIGMRIGLHVGKFLTADIGTPHRMEHILLGGAVLEAKHAESKGKTGKVCLTPETSERAGEHFRLEGLEEGFSLVTDDLSEKELGDYDIMLPTARMASMMLFDNTREGLIKSIQEAIDTLEPLASFIPRPVLNLLVENASTRGLPPDFPRATILFINLLGLPDDLESVEGEGLTQLVNGFSRLISVINAEIETHGGVMKKVTYHHAGPDIMAFFGTPSAHTNDSERAIRAALEIRKIVNQSEPIKIGERDFKMESHIGLNRGQAFAAEIGDKQGRREFNVLGNTINTAARLMDFAKVNQIILSESVFDDVEISINVNKMEDVKLKGRSQSLTLYELLDQEDKK
ncbi:MAG: adenylate/guanylate cyclase domain-containing protein [Anaerolineae bacterium]|nr:MAG: adenylate/guanylate cyclase domain-containing protein [Anaerolineae bacterium]